MNDREWMSLNSAARTNLNGGARHDLNAYYAPSLNEREWMGLNACGSQFMNDSGALRLIDLTHSLNGLLIELYMMLGRSKLRVRPAEFKWLTQWD